VNIRAATPMAEGGTRAWLNGFETGWETKCERSSGTGLCLTAIP